MSMCELHWLRGDLDAAERWAREATDLATRASEQVNTGESHVWLARIAEARGDTAGADAEFESAFGHLKASIQRSSRAHALYGELLEARGDLGAAIRQFKQALATRASESSVESAAAAAASA